MEQRFSNYETESFFNHIGNERFKESCKHRNIEDIAAKMQRHVEHCVNNFKPSLKNDLVKHSLEKVNFMEIATALKNGHANSKDIK
jgi:hypothetical protein